MVSGKSVNGLVSVTMEFMPEVVSDVLYLCAVYQREVNYGANWERPRVFEGEEGKRNYESLLSRGLNEPLPEKYRKPWIVPFDVTACMLK